MVRQAQQEIASRLQRAGGQLGALDRVFTGAVDRLNFGLAARVHPLHGFLLDGARDDG